ncbi:MULTISPECIES: hypothetical protein [unclassified Bartonella]|uniref:hypothetical protein n=1 Tax=unclassified Bartonella TaxID=2645622 RepID=UPI0035D07E39
MKCIKSIQPPIFTLMEEHDGTITKNLPAPHVAESLWFERRFIKGMPFLYSFYPHGPPAYNGQESNFN